MRRIVDAWVVAQRNEEFLEGVERRETAMAEGDRAGVIDEPSQRREMFADTDALRRLKSWNAPDAG